MKPKALHGHVHLQALGKTDMPWFYEITSQSEGSQYWYGPLTGYEVPGEKRFFEDFHPDYFDRRKKKSGQAYAILLSDERIGIIVYNAIEKQGTQAITELDILIGHSKMNLIEISRHLKPNSKKENIMPRGGGGGSGQGKGMGGGGGRGRHQGGMGAGVGGSCVCTQCGATVAHQQGQPCFQVKCPQCGGMMTRGQ